MSLENITFVSYLIVIVLLLLSLIYIAGIVWRVEMELDIAYKLFFVAVVFLVLAEVIEKFFSETAVYVAVAAVLKVIFAVLLLSGVVTMRDLIRKMDGEKPQTE